MHDDDPAPTGGDIDGPRDARISKLLYLDKFQEVKKDMSMTKVRFLQTTTAAGRRHAKGDEVPVDEMTAWDLVATGKARS